MGLLRTFPLFTTIPHDIAPCLTVWGAEINVELALILGVEIWKIFKYYESKANTHVQQWAWVVCAYCSIRFSRASTSVSSFDATLFLCVE